MTAPFSFSSPTFTFTAFVGVMCAVCIALGLWQLERRHWKLNLIEHVAQAQLQPPITISTAADLAKVPLDYRDGAKVEIRATLDPAREFHAYVNYIHPQKRTRTQGYWVFSPAKFADGTHVIINRGVVPLDSKSDMAARAKLPTQLVGVMRTSEYGNYMSPAADMVKNIWYIRKVEDMAQKWGIAPLPYYVQLIQTDPNAWPHPQTFEVNLPNNHLGYAFTWFGLALTIAVGYMVWLKQR